jgi:hypothetical protein
MSEHSEHPTEASEAPIATAEPPAAAQNGTDQAAVVPAVDDHATAEPPAHVTPSAAAGPAGTGVPAPVTEPAEAERAPLEAAPGEAAPAEAGPAEPQPDPAAAPSAAPVEPIEAVPATPEHTGEPDADSAPTPSTEPEAAGSAAETPAAASARPPRRRPERRRRPSPAQRHRNAFYAKLSELRRQDEAEQEGKSVEPTAEDAANETAQEETPTETPAPEAPSPAPPVARGPLPARAQARIRAAVERVGGEEAVREALAPKQRTDGQTMKWSAVCCDAAQGLAAGDPVFTAWARLAVTPVREIKNFVDPRDRDGRGRRGGGGPGGRRDGRGGGGGGGGDRPWRGGGGGNAGAQELLQHGRDGSFKSRIRIVDMSKDRDENRADQGEVKRREAAERLDRLGY